MWGFEGGISILELNTLDVLLQQTTSAYIGGVPLGAPHIMCTAWLHAASCRAGRRLRSQQQYCQCSAVFNPASIEFAGYRPVSSCVYYTTLGVARHGVLATAPGACVFGGCKKWQEPPLRVQQEWGSGVPGMLLQGGTTL